MTFSDKIKKIRLDNNLTQQQFADKLSISRSVVAKWEQDRGMPSLDLLKKISKTFDVSVEYLLGENNLENIQTEGQPIKQVKTPKRRLKTFMKIASIVLCAILLASVLIVPRFFWVDETYERSFYGVVTVEDDQLVVSKEIASTNNVEKFIIPKSKITNVEILDVDDNLTNLHAIKTGNRVRVDYKSIDRYYADRKTEYQKIKIIDDYYEGEKSLIGFFISLNEYEGDKPPINYPKYNYSNPEYEDRGKDTLYPFVFYNQGLTLLFDFIEDSGAIEIDYNLSTSYSYVHYAQVKRYDDVYLYLLDDSEKGYSLYAVLNRTNPSITLPDVIRFNSNNKDDVSKKYSKRYKNVFTLRFTNYSCSSAMIVEYDKNNKKILEKKVNNYNEFRQLPSKYMLQDETRYFTIINDSLNYNAESGPYVAGEVLELKIATASGFITSKKIEFY